MENLTVTKILAVYAKIERKQEMRDLVTDETLSMYYGLEAIAMWEVLQVMYGHEQISQTINAVTALAEHHNNKAVA
jgi:hypothetical protein